MSKHTPGPWQIRGEADDITIFVPIAHGLCFEIAQSIGGQVRGKKFDDFKEVEANARLIAAAPDLLEALHDLLCNVADPPARKRARIAIEKATGAKP